MSPVVGGEGVEDGRTLLPSCQQLSSKKMFEKLMAGVSLRCRLLLRPQAVSKVCRVFCSANAEASSKEAKSGQKSQAQAKSQM